MKCRMENWISCEKCKTKKVDAPSRKTHKRFAKRDLDTDKGIACIRYVYMVHIQIDILTHRYMNYMEIAYKYPNWHKTVHTIHNCDRNLWIAWTASSTVKGRNGGRRRKFNDYECMKIAESA